MPSFAMKTLFFDGNGFDNPEDPPAACVYMLHWKQLSATLEGSIRKVLETPKHPLDL